MCSECHPAGFVGRNSIKMAKTDSFCSKTTPNMPIMHYWVQKSYREASFEQNSTKMAKMGSLCSETPFNWPIVHDCAQNVVRRKISISNIANQLKEHQNFLICNKTIPIRKIIYFSAQDSVLYLSPSNLIGAEWNSSNMANIAIFYSSRHFINFDPRMFSKWNSWAIRTLKSPNRHWGRIASWWPKLAQIIHNGKPWMFGNQSTFWAQSWMIFERN